MNIEKKMEILMKPIDKQIMMCDNYNDLLALASVMVTSSKQILVAIVGPSHTKKILQELVDEL